MHKNNDQAGQQAPIQSAELAEPMTTDQAREFLIGFMNEHFTDRTFHRYIRADAVDKSRLAGDFAWQMATALRKIGAAPAHALTDAARLDWMEDMGCDVITDISRVDGDADPDGPCEDIFFTIVQHCEGSPPMRNLAREPRLRSAIDAAIAAHLARKG